MKKSLLALAFVAVAAMAVGVAHAAGLGIAIPHTELLGSLQGHDIGMLPLAFGATSSKFFRVATEGATTDGRNIERSWIEQMAKNFNRAKYGARVWLEHMRGLYPDSAFKAYGDVTAVEARKVEDGKLALFAQLEPLPELVAMNKAKQKIYTSIEVNPKFADTGEAYLVGLAVTDSPASLGTEMLQFAQQHPEANPLAARKQDPGNLFTQAIETELDFTDEPPAVDEKTLVSKFKDIVAKAFGQGHKTVELSNAAILAGVQELAQAAATGIAAEAAARQAAEAKLTQLSQDFATLKSAHDALVAKLDGQPSHQHNQRPPASGGPGAELTDC